MPQSYPRSTTHNNGANGKRLPGRPRSEQSHQAILRSTLKLLRQPGGFPDLSIEAVAADAKVSKATVYRWWPTKAALVADAFSASVEQELQFPDTGSLRGDVAQQMRRVIRLFRSPRGKIVAALLAGGQSDAELIEAFRERFLWPKRRQAYKTLERAIDRGELPVGSDLDLLLDSLYGPIYMRFLIRHAELTEDFADQLCGLILKDCERSPNV
jgi:AcrR family transcriptional regulator